MSKDTRDSTPPGIAKRWPTLLMIKLGRITMHRFTEALEPFGIRPRHMAALIELRDRGELTQQSLCGQLHLDPTNLVAILNELEQRGYATRRRDPEDRRRHLVEVSKTGIAVIEKSSEVMDGVQDELLDGLEPAEREQLEGLLTSIWSEAAATRPGPRSQPMRTTRLPKTSCSVGVAGHSRSSVANSRSVRPKRSSRAGSVGVQPGSLAR